MKGDVVLRAVIEGDLPVFFEQQGNPTANAMAAFPPRERDAFVAHWIKILSDTTVFAKTILYDGQVAGNVVSFERDGQREVGYWIGQEYWGRGIATKALVGLLQQVTARPLIARAAKHNTGSIRVLQKCGFTITGEDVFTDVNGQTGKELILTLEADRKPA